MKIVKSILNFFDTMWFCISVAMAGEDETDAYPDDCQLWPEFANGDGKKD